MNELIKVRNVEPLDGHWIRLSFSDGAVRDVDAGEVLQAGGVFAPIRDSRELFEQVRVNPETQTVEGLAGSTSIPACSTAVTNQPQAFASNAG
jgi:hypothetical protein